MLDADLVDTRQQGRGELVDDTGRPAVNAASGRQLASRGWPTANQFSVPVTCSRMTSRTLDGRRVPSRARAMAACCHWVCGTVRSTAAACCPPQRDCASQRGPAAVAYSRVSCWAARAPSSGTSRVVPLSAGSANHGVTSRPPGRVREPVSGSLPTSPPTSLPTASCHTSVPGAGAGTGEGLPAAAANAP